MGKSKVSSKTQPKQLSKFGIDAASESGCHTFRAKIRRLFHWGPLIALFIIVYIAVICTNAIFQWWPPLASIGGMIHMAVYVFEFYLVMSNYLTGCFMGPGFVPYFWQPENKLDGQFLQYCNMCEAFKPPRAHHCRKCDRCVLKMDHHCPWINTCCGHFNHGFFVYFLLFAPVGCIHSTVILCSVLYRFFFMGYFMMIDNPPFIYMSVLEVLMTLFATGLAVGVVLAVGGLFVVQFRSILKNESGIESWILEKAEYRPRDPGEPEDFIYPYHLGRWQNIKQVLTWSGQTVGDGAKWPVREGCSEFDLTIEQLKQKRQKVLQAITYRITEHYRGAVMPLFSQGCRVCYAMPCTDEPRLAVAAGQRVRVTRWRKHWLYGQMLDDEPGLTSNGIKKVRRRGWFPRRCAVEDDANNRNRWAAGDSSNRKKD